MSYVISRLSKEDILQNEAINWHGKITEQMLTDDVMQRIADKLGDDYCEQLFWISLEIITEHVLEKELQNDSSRA